MRRHEDGASDRLPILRNRGASPSQSDVLPLFVLLACCLFIFSPLVADPDLWGHVRFGQDTLLARQVVRSDSYSYLTAGQTWINHEWLTEVIYAWAYDVAGPRGLIALNSSLSLLIAGLIYWRLRGARMGRVAAVLLTLGACLVLRPAVLNVRPQVFTYLLFLLLLLLVDAVTSLPRTPPLRSARGREVRGLWFPAATFVLFAVWANLHGGVLAGLGILYLWGVIYLGEAELRDRTAAAAARPSQRSVLLALLLAPLALLLTPYGRDLAPFLLRTATVARPEILEWHPARLTDLWSQYWLVAVLLTILAAAVSQKRRRLCLLLPLAVIALMPLSAVRHIPLFAIAAPVLAADHFASLWDRLHSRFRMPWFSSPRAQRSTRLVCGATAIAFTALAVPRLQAIVIEPASAGFPVKAVAVLNAAGLSGNLATEFNWGEYVVWHLGPAMQVSVDGRRETVYSDAVYDENLDFMRGEGEWDRLVDRPETSLALVDRERPAYGLMRQKAGWVLAYEDAAAALFVRAGSTSESAVKQVVPPAWPADGAGLAFPVE